MAKSGNFKLYDSKFLGPQFDALGIPVARQGGYSR